MPGRDAVSGYRSVPDSWCSDLPIRAVIRERSPAAFRVRFGGRFLTLRCGESGAVQVTLLPSRRAVSGGKVFGRAAHGVEGETLHPETGAAQQPAVAVREPVETRAAKRKIPPRRLLPSNRRLTAVNLLILKRGL